MPWHDSKEVHDYCVGLIRKVANEPDPVKRNKLALGILEHETAMSELTNGNFRLFVGVICSHASQPSLIDLIKDEE